MGFQTLLVDAAEISSQSLRQQFSGHAVVAIRSKDASTDTPWWLVDSTSLKLISRNWWPTEKSFRASGRVFWIGYCGPLSDYAVHKEKDLKAFYARTLADVSPDSMNRTLIRFKFTVDPSLIDNDGKYLNSRLANFIREQSIVFAEHDVEPEREVSILLKHGSKDEKSDLAYSEASGWVSHIGLKSGCSPSLLSYFELAISRRDESKSESDVTPK